MSQLANQIAVVTGAGRGIGRAIAVKFAAEGADVVCVSRTQENSEKVANEIGALGKKAWAFAVDVSDSAAVSAAAEKILADCGKVDILVNNAGVTRDGLLMRMSDADWDTVLNTNLKGAFLVTKAFSRAMIKARAGRIINVSSVIGLIGHAGQCNYAASKAGLIGFTQSVAKELASRGITVNAIAPGFFATNIGGGHAKTASVQEAMGKVIPIHRVGFPADTAGLTLFLASPASAYLTGQQISIDGGWSLGVAD
jgi:3-oxoacyl-[acyl-carrier protein] reductase